MIRAAIYPRVSTQEQVNGYSINEQTERLSSYCAAMGWSVVGTYTDAGYSGGSLNRPGLQRMITDIEHGKIDKVVVYKLDRLSRSQKDALHLIEDVFLPHNVGFVSITENFDTSTAFGKAAIGMTACFAQLEKENIKQRMEMGREARAKSGKWLGARYTPIGYNYIDGKLEIDEYGAAIVRDVYRRYLSGESVRDIEKAYFNTDKLQKNNIKYILKNDLYVGFVRYGGKSYPGIHEPIVTMDEYTAVQKRMAEQQARYKSSNLQTNGDTHSTLLGGLVYCARCGARYGKSYCGAVNRRFSVYECYSRSKDNLHMVTDISCKNTIYRVGELDAAVLDRIASLAREPRKIETMTNPIRPTKDAIQKEIDKTNNQISRFLDLYGIGKLSVDQIDAKIAPLEEKRAALQTQLDADDTRITIKQAQKTLESFADVIATGDRAAIRKLVESLIDRIDIDGDTITISWRFA